MEHEGKYSEQQLVADAAFMDKYSRQIGAFGMEAMSKLVRLKVLIFGMKTIGIEAAKNLILAGPGIVTVADADVATMKDLGRNFFLREEHVGQPIASSVASQLQELNSMVIVRSHDGALTEELVAQHNVVVMCGVAGDELVRWNDFCHARNIGFLACDARGPAGYFFADFGDRFVVRDKTGENPVTRIITHISNEEEGVVTLLGAFGEDGGRMHGIQDDDHEGWVEISDVEGMEATDGKHPASINECEAFRIKTATKKVMQEVTKDGKKQWVEKQVYDPYRLIIGDTTRFSAYQNGGILTQVKKPVTIQHRPLQANLTQPVAPGEFGLAFTDGAKFGRAEQLHFAFLALWEFHKANGRFPELRNEAEATEVVRLANEINNRHKKLNEDANGDVVALALDELDEDVVKKVALHAAVELQPVGCFFGGLVAQEVVKFTAKFTPLHQWLHIDFLEVLPDEVPQDTAPQNSRYDDLIQLYGAEFVEKMRNGRTFMVGCGALGCEFFKNFALLGVGTGPQGLITVTDNDRIEVSNLSRQFLFREHNVGQPKSIAAAQAALKMNPDLKIDARETFVAPHTEDNFPDDFWESLTFVTGALDNVKARQYVDSKCVFYTKPLLESGTLGTKCNAQVIVPHVTASYTDGPQDADDEDNIPMCTLRNFPSLIEHCIEWSRAQFEDIFGKDFADVKKFLADKQGYIAQQRVAGQTSSGRATAIAEMKKALEILEDASKITFEACVHKAFVYFYEVFRDRILNLIHNYPEDAVTKTGEKFWSGAKRFPLPAELDLENNVHMEFIKAVANIFACCYGLRPQPELELLPADHQWRNDAYIRELLGSFKVPTWTPTIEKVDEEEEENKEESNTSAQPPMDIEADEQEFARLLAALENYNAADVNVEPADFEKDQDMNFHIDFIASAANLRASNYRIRQATRHKCKMIAGKIIPAIATTTASVTGLVMIELLKLLQNKPLEAYKDSSNNLALNMYMMQEPAPPVRAKDEHDPIMMTDVKCYPEGFTKWDKIVIARGRLTMQQFIDAFKEQTGLNITVLYHQAAELEGPQKGRSLYESWTHKKELRELYNTKLEADLLDWIEERYQGAPIAIVGGNKQYLPLVVSCNNDEGEDFKTPTVVYKWV